MSDMGIFVHNMGSLVFVGILVHRDRVPGIKGGELTRSTLLLSLTTNQQTTFVTTTHPSHSLDYHTRSDPTPPQVKMYSYSLLALASVAAAAVMPGSPQHFANGITVYSMCFHLERTMMLFSKHYPLWKAQKLGKTTMKDKSGNIQPATAENAAKGAADGSIRVRAEACFSQEGGLKAHICI